ncbi:MAG TPA: hypothetical protein VMV69_29020 [Pirellulales bacterium]|nr:hypothetical protein [Pirellulales bacterium]
MDEMKHQKAADGATTKPAGSTIEFYGGYQVYSESGVDLTLLKRRLAMTPTERWEENSQALHMVEAFREAGRVRRAANPSPVDRPKG